MKSIRLENLQKSLQGGLILNGINLTIPAGKFFALLGPSGCGKTTLLRLIAGLEEVDAGRIFLGEEEITHLPIHQRPVNVVFQNYALFPHLTVFENIAYGLRIKKLKKKIIKEKVFNILSMFHLENQAHKLPGQLSGGQQQRVALARAIINEPAVLLLDEPLAALDLKLSERLVIQLIKLHHELKNTFLYVTHNQSEALTVADQLAIMNQSGQIEQIGTPKEIYEFPQTAFVAQFVGTTNLLSGTIHDIDSQPYLFITELGKFPLHIDQKKQWIEEGSKIMMSIRPEKICISKTPLLHFSNNVKGVVDSIVYHGRSTQYNVILPNKFRFQVFEQNEHHDPQLIDYDQEVYLYWQKENAVLLEK
jgi:spermidine/putrescine transport system ATP-binding protein